MSYRYPLQEIVQKMDSEGGLGESFFYFGRELNSESDEVNEAWRKAYDAIKAVEALLPELDWDWVDE